MARAVLLDTCAAIWLMNGDPMSADSRASVTAAQAGNLGVYVSPMTAWEIATLVSKNRLRLSLSLEAWFDALLGFAGVRLGTASDNRAQRRIPAQYESAGKVPMGLRPADAGW